MKVQISARSPSSVKIKFTLGTTGAKGDQGDPGDITPEFLALAAQIEADAATASDGASTATTQAGIATDAADTATAQAAIATTGAGTATTQAGIATTQAGIATTKAGEAATSETNAAASAAAAATFDPAFYVTKANNLSDLASASTARTNLGLGNVTNTSDANKPVSTAQATAIGLRLLTSNNLSDLPSVATARTNLGIGKRYLGGLKVTSGTSTGLIVAIPSDVNLITIAGQALAGTATSAFFRFSYDGGATYASGASEYVRGALFSSNTTVSAAPNTAASFAFLTGTTTVATLPMGFSYLLTVRDGGTNLNRWIGQNGGFNASGHTLTMESGYALTTTRPTHIQITAGAAFAVDTNILVEGW